MKLFLQALIVCALVALPAAFLYSQTADDGCPENNGGCVIVNEYRTTYGWALDVPYCSFIADFTVRECSDGSFQYIMHSLTPNTTGGPCDILSTLNENGWSLSTLMELAQLQIIQDHLTNGFSFANPPIPPPLQECNGQGTNNRTMVQFYSANCWKWQRCTWGTDGQEAECVPPLPAPGTPPTVNTYTWHSCGRTCCKRTYEACYRVQSFPAGGVVNQKQLVITNVQIIQDGECSLQNEPQFVGYPCDHGCDPH